MKGGQYTVSDVAKALHVTGESVRRYIREGKLKASKKRTVGLKKVWLVSPEDLRKFQEDE
jgi:predicted RNA-binding protein associated with RNAse of E/G family